MNEERFSRSIETSINQFPTLYVFTHPQAFRPYVSGIMMDEGEIDEACARFEQAVQTQSIRYSSRIPLESYRSTLYHSTYILPFLFVIILCAGKGPQDRSDHRADRCRRILDQRGQMHRKPDHRRHRDAFADPHLIADHVLMSFLSDQLTWISLTILSLILVMAKGPLHRVHSK